MDGPYRKFVIANLQTSNENTDVQATSLFS